MRHSFAVFAMFFKRAATESVSIDRGQMNYGEFAELANCANQMVTDRNLAEVG